MPIPERACIDIQDALEQIEEYLDDLSDADLDGDSYRGNLEMQLLMSLQMARQWIDQLIRDNVKGLK